MPDIRRSPALGLVRHSPTDNELRRSTSRVELAFHAKLAGFALAETFELDGHPDKDRRTLRAVDGFLQHSPARVLILHGPVDETEIAPMVDRYGLRLVAVSPPPPVGAV